MSRCWRTSRRGGLAVIRPERRCGAIFKNSFSFMLPMVAQAPSDQMTTMTSGIIKEKSLAAFFALQMHQKINLGFGLPPCKRRTYRPNEAMQRRVRMP